MEWFYSRDIAMLAAQIGPVLLVAYVVELRAIAERRSLEGSDARSMVWFVSAVLGLLLVTCFVVVNGAEDLTGDPALTAWVFTLMPLSILIFFVGVAAWAAVRISAHDADGAQAKGDASDHHLRTSGWKWSLRGRPEPLHVVAAVITRRDGAVLACRRAAGKESAGKWEFPGGKVDAGEQPGEALIREIREELGVKARIIEPLTSDVTVVDRRAIRLSCFIVKTGKPPTTSTDHDRLEWVPRRELAGRDWAAPDLPAVRKLMKSAK